MQAVSHTCAYCSKPANGSVGSLIDPSFIEWVCEYCYYNVLHMKPLSEATPEELKHIASLPNKPPGF